jgi:uncharacterized membrane protein YkoI
MRFSLHIYIAAFILLYSMFAQAEPFVSMEKARAVAIDAVPGELEEADSELNNGVTLYQFKIRREDGAVVDVEIDGDTGAILKKRVGETPVKEAADLPEPQTSEKQARTTALAYIRENVKTLARETVIESEYKLVKGEPVYAVEIEKNRLKYEVLVDPGNGNALSYREIY